MPIPLYASINIDNTTITVDNGYNFNNQGTPFSVDSQGYALYNGVRFYQNGTLVLGTDFPSGDYDTIGDLTGTKWLINDAPSMLYNNTFNINFVSNNITYSSLKISNKSGFDSIIYGSDTAVYDDGTWADNAYKTIEITGGTDVTNTTLIAWLEANATQIVEPEPSSNNKILLGNLPIDKMYLGNLLIKAMYFGGTKIYNEGESESTPTLISFIINSTAYQADENMTWSEWVASEYNTLGLVESDSDIRSPAGYPLELNTTPVAKTDTIIANASYEVLTSGGGNPK